MNLNTRAIGAMIVVTLAIGILALPSSALPGQPADPVKPPAILLPSADGSTIALAADDSNIQMTLLGTVPLYPSPFTPSAISTRTS
ncbi:MAG TPA: hypothetical protein VLI39_14325 [Sedimentisphaerales bacterium]|nr:hypothetical protein [Sedimentisphaerales bacterium]